MKLQTVVGVACHIPQIVAHGGEVVGLCLSTQIQIFAISIEHGASFGASTCCQVIVHAVGIGAEGEGQVGGTLYIDGRAIIFGLYLALWRICLDKVGNRYRGIRFVSVGVELLGLFAYAIVKIVVGERHFLGELGDLVKLKGDVAACSRRLLVANVVRSIGLVGVA